MMRSQVARTGGGGPARLRVQEERGREEERGMVRSQVGPEFVDLTSAPRRPREVSIVKHFIPFSVNET